MRGDGGENNLLGLTSLLGFCEGFSELRCAIVNVISLILRRWIRRIIARRWGTTWGSTCMGLSMIRWGSAPATMSRPITMPSTAATAAAAVSSVRRASRRASSRHFGR